MTSSSSINIKFSTIIMTLRPTQLSTKQRRSSFKRTPSRWWITQFDQKWRMINIWIFNHTNKRLLAILGFQIQKIWCLMLWWLCLIKGLHIWFGSMMHFICLLTVVDILCPFISFSNFLTMFFILITWFMNWHLFFTENQRYTSMPTQRN